MIRDDTCIKGLAALINDIINDDLPTQAKDFILSSRLIAIDKNNGNNLRPIAIGEYFYRLAAYRQIKQVNNQVPQLFLPIQLGVGISGGCENIIHNIQHALQDSNNPVAALAIDFKNAFNSISRHAVLDALYNQPSLQPLFKLVNFAYSAPSILFVRYSNGALIPKLQSSYYKLLLIIILLITLLLERH